VKADHRKPVLAFGVLVVLAAAVVGSNRADARHTEYRAMGSISAYTAAVHGSLPDPAASAAPTALDTSAPATGASTGTSSDRDGSAGTSDRRRAPASGAPVDVRVDRRPPVQAQGATSRGHGTVRTPVASHGHPHGERPGQARTEPSAQAASGRDSGHLRSVLPGLDVTAQGRLPRELRRLLRGGQDASLNRQVGALLESSGRADGPALLDEDAQQVMRALLDAQSGR
jgi:hypothetical protein